MSQLFETTDITEYIWTGNSQLKRVITFYPPYTEWNANYEESYSFGTGWNPLKGMNIALVVVGHFEWSEFSVHQNLYCTTMSSDNYLAAEVVYEYNAQNYPIKADILYDFDLVHDYAYFEYESY